MDGVTPFSRSWNTKAINKLLEIGKLSFTKGLTILPKRGTIVKHDALLGTSSRIGWIGIIEDFNPDNQYTFIRVRWLLDAEGKSIMSNRFRQRCTEGGVVQTYSKDWAKENIISGKFKNHNIFDLLKLKQEKQGMGNFIVWSPKGSTNPSVTHGSEKQATKVAEDMARKYGGEFYVCKCISKSVRQDVVTTKL